MYVCFRVNLNSQILANNMYGIPMWSRVQICKYDQNHVMSLNELSGGEYVCRRHPTHFQNVKYHFLWRDDLYVVAFF